MNKINYSRNFGGYLNALPKHFQFIDLQAIMGITRNIDNNNTGLVNWRQFLTYLTLGNSPLPTVNKLNEAKQSAGGRDVMTKEQFVSVSKIEILIMFVTGCILVRRDRGIKRQTVLRTIRPREHDQRDLIRYQRSQPARGRTTTALRHVLRHAKDSVRA